MAAPIEAAAGHSLRQDSGEPAWPFMLAAWLIAAFLLWLVLHVDLLPALLAGMLVFQLVHVLSARLTRVRERRARILAVALIATAVIGLLTLAIVGTFLFFGSESGGYVALLQKSAEVIQRWRHLIPDWMANSIPADADGLRDRIAAWLRQHVGEVQTLGQQAAEAFVRIAIAMVVGALVALRQADAPTAVHGPLVRGLAGRVRRFSEAFRHVVFAQVRIAALNALLTAVYLVVLLPLLGIGLPLLKTMIFITFVAGLVPVVGNLISNVVVVIVSLGASPIVAAGSLVYLVLIHKLEYFLNARMIGTRIEARAWELLLAMLVMEAAFGIVGLIAAPIYYAYLKDELSAKDWI